MAGMIHILSEQRTVAILFSFGLFSTNILFLELLHKTFNKVKLYVASIFKQFSNVIIA